MSSRQKVQCTRCKTRASFPKAAADNWNMTIEQSVCVGHLCPNCQTVEENTEAEINAATTRYGLNAFGQMIGTPKVEV